MTSTVTRRRVAGLVGAATAAAIVPVAATIAKPVPSRTERIREHLDAIIALMREELPGDYYDRMLITTGLDWGPVGQKESGGPWFHVDTFETVLDHSTAAGFWVQWERDKWHLRANGTVRHDQDWLTTGDYDLLQRRVPV